MGSERARRIVHALTLCIAGGAVALAAIRGLYATGLLAALIAIWVAALGLVDRSLPAPVLAPPPGAVPDEEERRRLIAYLDLSPAPLVALDDNRLSAVNRAARVLLGVGDLVPDPPATLLAALSDTRPGRTATIDLGKGGDIRSFALTTGDLALSGRRTRIGALIDIDAELKAAEAAALRELVQVLSHETVNALTPIVSLADTAVTMLDDPVPPLPQIREAIETVARRAASLHRFGESYRSLARLPPPAPQRIAVLQFASDLAKLFATRWPAIALTVETQNAPAYLIADPDQLTAALWAILQNAAEALHETRNARIVLDVTAHVGRTVITIVDNGPGISSTDETDIFRPFFTTKSQGTGIGLSLARQILRGHSGDLTLASSSPGKTAFEATIPG
ncbi:integral membrane sensor signal transduction histidine kinase [Novosphingobium sp. Rr 2-17]|uniref:sensor histidine kinase n=1 Tax=Novosphingobium sp. Rr 2-17 TaxID=555793 RepID=UPI000269955B|nr:ATP-binding protein [Novosphingobium sp. Rr 2-17]EIZ78046.1 integral membrane sensor signal transduction histidine kinase [Novosphingobium sp. Rr 2-17]